MQRLLIGPPLRSETPVEAQGESIQFQQYGHFFLDLETWGRFLFWKDAGGFSFFEFSPESAKKKNEFPQRSKTSMADQAKYTFSPLEAHGFLVVVFFLLTYIACLFVFFTRL